MSTQKFEVFYDGDCPLCMREIRFLKKRDKKDTIEFRDISHASFDATEFGKTQDEFMAQIWGRRPDGTFVSGVEVFRQLYTRVGFSWIVSATRIPGISWLLDRAYDVFAKNRLRLTGRGGKRCATGSATGAATTGAPANESSS